MCVCVCVCVCACVRVRVCVCVLCMVCVTINILSYNISIIKNYYPFPKRLGVRDCVTNITSFPTSLYNYIEERENRHKTAFTIWFQQNSNKDGRTVIIGYFLYMS